MKEINKNKSLGIDECIVLQACVDLDSKVVNMKMWRTGE